MIRATSASVPWAPRCRKWVRPTSSRMMSGRPASSASKVMALARNGSWAASDAARVCRKKVPGRARAPSAPAGAQATGSCPLGGAGGLPGERRRALLRVRRRSSSSRAEPGALRPTGGPPASRSSSSSSSSSSQAPERSRSTPSDSRSPNSSAWSSAAARRRRHRRRRPAACFLAAPGREQQAEADTKRQAEDERAKAGTTVPFYQDDVPVVIMIAWHAGPPFGAARRRLDPFMPNVGMPSRSVQCEWLRPRRSVRRTPARPRSADGRPAAHGRSRA